MVSPFEALVLVVSVAAIASLASLYTRRVGPGLVAITLSTFLVLSSSLPAHAAAAAKDKSIPSAPQKQLNTVLETTPDGNQFQGIEYPEVKGTPLSDAEIERKIRSDISDEIATSVSNGAVRLSGEVKNQKVAERIVNEVKQIPGVHEITFDLGLTDINADRQNEGRMGIDTGR